MSRTETWPSVPMNPVSSRLLLAAALSAGSALGQSGSAPFGPASSFDVWGTTGVHLHSAALPGRVCGNKFVELHHFVVGQNPSLTAGQDVVISGGLLRMRSGTVSNGQAVYGTLLDVDPTVQFRNAAQGPRLEDLFDDEALRRVLRHQSVELGLRPATGVVSTFGPHLELQGAETDLNIFQLTTEQLEAASQVVLSVPPGSAALLNIEGGVWEQSSWTLQLTGLEASRVLVNAFEGSSLTLSNAQLDASLLAPRAVLDIQRMGVAGNIIGRYVQMTSAHTLGQHLAGDEWLTSGAGFEADETGHDAATYSLVWTEQAPGEQIEVMASGPETLELIVDGTSRLEVRRDRISRLVLVGQGSPATTTVDSSLGLTVEWTRLAPVAFDDCVALPPGANAVEVDALENDLGQGLDPATVELMSPPLVGSATVDPSTGRIRYELPTMGPLAQLPWRHAVLWYRVRDARGVASSPRRVLVALEAARGLRLR